MTATAGSPVAVQYFATRQRFRENFDRALRDYLGRPDEKNAHDLRVALRRVQAYYRSLPKETRRTKRVRKYEDRCSKVVKLTSRVRDIDILISKLNGDGTATRGPSNQVLRTLQLERLTAVEMSMQASWKLFESSKPSPDGQTPADMERQISRVVAKLRAKIRKELPRVVSEERDTKELHRLRKLCKRLRYALELKAAQNDGDVVVKVLREWQDKLGDIRDSDVFLNYLESRLKGRGAWIGDMIRAERARRHDLFEEFVSDSRRKKASSLLLDSPVAKPSRPPRGSRKPRRTPPHRTKAEGVDRTASESGLKG